MSGISEHTYFYFELRRRNYENQFSGLSNKYLVQTGFLGFNQTIRKNQNKYLYKCPSNQSLPKNSRQLHARLTKAAGRWAAEFTQPSSLPSVKHI